MDKVVLQVFTCRDVEMISSDLTSNLIVQPKKGSGPRNGAIVQDKTFIKYISYSISAHKFQISTILGDTYCKIAVFII